MQLRHYLAILGFAIALLGLPLLIAGMHWATLLCMGVSLLLVSSAAMMTPDETD